MINQWSAKPDTSIPNWHIAAKLTVTVQCYFLINYAVNVNGRVRHSMEKHARWWTATTALACRTSLVLFLFSSFLEILIRKNWDLFTKRANQTAQVQSVTRNYTISYRHFITESYTRHETTSRYWRNVRWRTIEWQCETLWMGGTGKAFTLQLPCHKRKKIQTLKSWKTYTRAAYVVPFKL